LNLENSIEKDKAKQPIPKMLEARVVRVTFAHKEDAGLKSRIIQCLSEAYLERLKQSDKEAQT
jgi:hypothetical protein